MAITYPVDIENTRWAVLQESTGEIIARNRRWPRADGGAIDGDPDYVYLLQVKTEPPQYDGRVYSLHGTETVDAPGNEIRTTWETTKRTIEERKIAAENVEVDKLGTIIDMQREVIETRLMLGALLKFSIDSQALPPKALAMANTYKQKAIRLWKNRDRLDAILTDIDNDLEPDLDAGWESDEPTP